MAITKEQSDQLKDYFPVKAHEFINGATYLSEEAITDRLDEVDPSWEFHRLGEFAYRENFIIATFRMTVCGVSRDGIGMWDLKMKKKDGTIIDAVDPEKSVSTDALKRAARLFGIGRYILEMGKAVTDYASLERWLAQKRRIDASTGEITLVSENGSNSQNSATSSDLPKAAGDYERTPQQKLAGNGAPQAGQKKESDADTREWNASAVTVRKDKFGKAYLQYTCTEGKPTGRGREHLRQAGYECEEWTVEGTTYDLLPPAVVTVQKNGNFWNVMSVKQTEVTF